MFMMYFYALFRITKRYFQFHIPFDSQITIQVENDETHDLLSFNPLKLAQGKFSWD
jgi:hypothetical protein